MRAVSRLIAKARDWIADTGQDPEFVTFQAHCWFAFSVTLIFWLWGYRFFFVAATVLAAALVKEFWFDARYERAPEQSFVDNLIDFVGYLSGVGLATVFARFL